MKAYTKNCPKMHILDARHTLYVYRELNNTMTIRGLWLLKDGSIATDFGNDTHIMYGVHDKDGKILINRFNFVDVYEDSGMRYNDKILARLRFNNDDEFNAYIRKYADNKSKLEHYAIFNMLHNDTSSLNNVIENALHRERLLLEGEIELEFCSHS